MVHGIVHETQSLCGTSDLDATTMSRVGLRKEHHGAGDTQEGGVAGASKASARGHVQRGALRQCVLPFVVMLAMVLPTLYMFSNVEERGPLRASLIKRFAKWRVILPRTTGSGASGGLRVNVSHPTRRTPPPKQAEEEQVPVFEARVTVSSVVNDEEEDTQEPDPSALVDEKAAAVAAVSGSPSHVGSYTDTTPSAGPGTGVTLVTAYFRIKSKHSDNDYDHWMANTMSVLDPMIIFTSADLADKMRGLRPHAADRTLVVPFELNATRMATSRSADFWAKQRLLDPETARHRSAELYWIWNQKPEWMSKAAGINPFGTRYFCWMDTGYLRHDKLNGQHLVGRMPADLRDDQLLLLNIARYKESDFAPGGLIASNRVSGNLFAGTAKSLMWWETAFYRAFDAFAEAGRFAGKDQHMMATACAWAISRCYLVQPIHEGRRLDRIERWFVMAFLLHGDAPMIRVGEVNQEAGHQHNLVVHHHHHHHRIGGHSREHPLGGIMECNAFVRLPWQGSDGAATDQDGLLNQVNATMWGAGGAGGGRCKRWFDVDRSNGTHHISFRGRMSNGIIEYLYTRIAADAAGVGIYSEGDGGARLKAFYQNIEFEPGGDRRVVPANKKCGPHFQDYAFFRHERCLAQCVLAPSSITLSPTLFELGGKDAVIHFRRPFFQFKGRSPHGIRRHTAWHTTPTYEYFSTVLDDLKRRDSLSRVYIVAEPAQRDDEIVTRLIEQYSARWVAEKPAQDHYLCRMAPVFIGSFGTFSWTIAYLSQGREIHLPIVSNMSYGSTWNWWDALFIEDDARITYHDEVLPDWGGIGGFLNASSVLDSGTVYAASIHNRTHGEMCDPRTDKVLAYARDKTRKAKDLYSGAEW